MEGQAVPCRLWAVPSPEKTLSVSLPCPCRATLPWKRRILVSVFTSLPNWCTTTKLLSRGAPPACRIHPKSGSPAYLWHPF